MSATMELRKTGESSASNADCNDVALADAFEVTAARFRDTGVFLALLDNAAHIVLYDEGYPNVVERSEMVAWLRSRQAVGAEDAESLAAAGENLRSVATSSRDIGPSRRLVACSTSLQADLLEAIMDAASGTLHDKLSNHEGQAQLTGITAQLADTYEELSLLYQVSGAMRVNRSPDEYFREVCGEVSAVLGARVVGAVVRPGRNSGNSLVVRGPLDLDPARLSRFVDEMTEILVDRTFQEAMSGPLVVSDVQGHEFLGFLYPGFNSVVATPLVRDDKVLGFLFAANKQAAAHYGLTSEAAESKSPVHEAPASSHALRRPSFNSVDAKLLQSVAAASAVYIENALMFDDMHGLMMGLLHSLTAAVDAKDSYTCGHSERVALLARMLAVATGFSTEEADRVYISGLLHDVGKIGVPEGVLQKAGKLTDEEFALMKQHPQIGARILDGVPQVQDVLPGVLHHHERFDGRGYPHQIAGEAIPVLGRIICIADSFDAMTTNRTYRRGMPLQQALDEIARCAGAQFDPVLAKQFVELGADRIDAALEQYRVRSGGSTVASPLALTLRAARAA